MNFCTMTLGGNFSATATFYKHAAVLAVLWAKAYAPLTSAKHLAVIALHALALLPDASTPIFVLSRDIDVSASETQLATFSLCGKFDTRVWRRSPSRHYGRGRRRKLGGNFWSVVPSRKIFNRPALVRGMGHGLLERMRIFERLASTFKAASRPLWMILISISAAL